MRKVYIQATVFEPEADNDEMEPALGSVSAQCVHSIGRLLDRCPKVDRNVPVCFGSAYSVLESLHAFNKVSVADGPLKVQPTRFPDTVLNAPACHASIRHHLTGPIYNFSNGLTSALDALGFAYIQIADEREDAVLVCAAEAASTIARVIDYPLTVSSSAALFMSSRPGPVEMLEYSIHVLPEPVEQGTPAHGCVEALRLIDEYICNDAKTADLELTLTEHPYQARVRLHKARNDVERKG